MTSSLPIRRAAVAGCGVAAAALVLGGHALAGGRDQKTTITIKRTVESSFGSDSYGGGALGGFVTQRREVDIGADGALRFPGVAASLDPATVEFRSITDPTGTRVVEQRLVNDLVNPEALLFRQIGKPITVTLVRGEIKGTLRAVSNDAMVIETVDHAVQIVQRGAQVVDVLLTAASVDQDPTLEWRVATAKPGRHTVEVSYRTDALAWQPEYSAILGDGGEVELSAWANVTNESGTDFVDAEITLSGGGGDGVAPQGAIAGSRPATTTPSRWKIPRPVTIRNGLAVQVELAARRTGAKARKVTVFEALSEQSGVDNAEPYLDCGGYTLNERTTQFLELDGSGGLPDGRVRMLRRVNGELTAAGEDQLRTNGATGAVRIGIGTVESISGSRSQNHCQPSATGRALDEMIELTVNNASKQAVEVVVREYMYRWHDWKIVTQTEKGSRASDRAQEWRLKVPAGGSKSVSYTVRYAW